ncbi:tetratricopeptide repeat protein [Vibrio sp. CAIM 722]|uniref:Tetratricopeptide repeat protein n=1 Tax=Vibrio eleionomae TaxID=2653505 RepID=A0A7X4LPY7_9VIBR|nr:tetratricopeptide repeat protein [Vibrio eleionomae]MZI96018.1 tetratricopeptide repeat protein [Vibrio eleionomae]
MRIFNLLLFIFGLSLLSGCTNKPSIEFSDQTNEKILQSSGNTQKLIEFYKKQLTKQERSDTRLKLVSTYESTGDFSSALFYLKPILNQKQDLEVKVELLAGRAYLNLHQFSQAEIFLSDANKRKPADAEVMNLLGVLSCYQGKLSQAQIWFSKARASMGNDQTIKNNLALVFLLQGDYITARRLLESLVVNDELDNKKVTANLAVVYAKQGDKQAFSQLTKSLSKEQSNALYMQLSELRLVNLQSLSVGSNMAPIEN